MSAAGEMSVPAARLHSRYNPRAEACRYLDTLNIKTNHQYFILIEPGLGYLAESLRKRGAGKIIALHADSGLRAYTAEPDTIPAWYPDSPISVQRFLENEIPDTPASRIKIIEWRPARDVYGRDYLSLLSEAADFVKRIDAEFRTGRSFGSRWARNFFRNLAYVNTALLYRPSDAPVIVTGSGPALEDALPRLREKAGQAFVLASSSSVEALNAGGVNADMLIATDGGSWARGHLYGCFRAQPAIPALAVNLCAALPSQCARYPFLVLNDGSLWQTIVLSALGIPSVIVPQRGTVTASALELALLLTSGNVYLAGVDLALRGIQTHARPYAFDYLFESTATRTQPLYCQRFVRARDTAGGGSLAVYAAWFKDRLKTWPARIYTLEQGNALFAPAPAVTPRCPHEQSVQTREIRGSPEKYRAKALAALTRALDNPDFTEPLTNELGALLFSLDDISDTAAIKKRLTELAQSGGSARA